MDDTLSVSVPVFDTVNVCVPGVPPMATFPNDREVADRTIVDAPVAVPLNATDEGLPAALWATDREAALFPANPEGVNVTVTVCAAPPGRIVNEVGLTENCAESAPVRVIDVTLSVSVPVLDTVNVCVPGVPPMATFPNNSEVADRTIVDVPVAVPLNVTTDGLPALWATDKEAALFPANPVGVNVTVTVCAAPPGRIVNEVGLTPNCAESAPTRAMDDTLSVSVPVLDTVKVCVPGVPPMATFPNDREVADRTIVDAPVAVPLNATDEGLPAALWATDREAALFPANPEGVNVTVTVCAAPPGRIVNEVGLTENCAESAPVRVIDVTLSVSVPVFDTVTVCATDEPMLTAPKDTETDERLIPGANVADACADAALLLLELSAAAILK